MSRGYAKKNYVISNSLLTPIGPRFVLLKALQNYHFNAKMMNFRKNNFSNLQPPTIRSLIASQNVAM